MTDLFPNKPENIQVVNVTSNQIKLEWCLPSVNPASVTHFTIKYSNIGEKFKPEEKLDKPHYCASALLPGTQYVFAISCCNKKHSGEQCLFSTKTMPGPPDPPEKPQLYTALDLEKNRIEYYVIFKKLSENKNGSPVSKILVESSNDAEKTKWVPQHHPVSKHDEVIKVPIGPYVQRSDVNFFYYRACFENEAGRSKYSDILRVSVMDLCPPAPKNFHVAQTFARRIRLEWDRSTYNPHSVMHYKVMMADNYQNRNKWINPVTVNDQFQIYGNLIPTRSYKFRVASCNSEFPAGGEWCEEVIVKTKADKPSRPCKPDVRSELDENGEIICLLMVTMLSKEQENGSPVEKIIIESKGHDMDKFDAKEYIACRSNPVQSFPIRTPNATETIKYRVRMKNQAGLSEPSDVYELESAQMIPDPPRNLPAGKDENNQTEDIRKGVKKIEKDITCPLCHNHFQDPKILPCLHYYCKGCIQVLAQRAGENKPFSCPKYRNSTLLPKNDLDRLPTAFFINRMTELHTKMEKVHGKIEAICEECTESKAVAFCHHCMAFICNTCVKIHKKLKVLTNHKVISLEELKKGGTKRLPLKQAPPPMCEVHDEQMKIYCYKCKHLICRDCIFDDHTGHKYDFVKKAAPAVKEKLAKHLVPLKEMQVCLYDATIKSAKSNVERQGTSIATSVEQSFQELHKILEQRKRELLEKTSDLTKEKLDRLNIQEKEFEIISSIIQSLVEFVEQNIENATEEELMTIHTQILGRIDEEKMKHQQSSAADLKPVEEADIIVGMECAEDLKTLCREKTIVTTSPVVRNPQCNLPIKTIPAAGLPDPPEKPQIYQVSDLDHRITYYVTFKRLSSENENGSPVSRILVESSNDAERTKWVPQYHPVSQHDEVIKVPIGPYVQRSDVKFFYYRACFEIEAGRSKYSEILHISVNDLYPPAPEDFHVARTFARRIRLEWNRPTYNPQSVMHYKVMMAENNHHTTQWINPIVVTDHFQIYDNLLPAKSYRFRAACCNQKFPAGGEWCKEVIVKTKADKPNRPCKPDIRCDFDENRKIRCLLMVTMLLVEQENGSPVEKIIVESKRRDVSKYDAKEYIAYRSNNMVELPIHPPNVTETFIIQYRVRMKNQAGSSEPSDIRELESAQMIPGPPKNLAADKDNILFNKIVLSWEEPDINPKSVEYYIIQKRLTHQANETDHEWLDIRKCDNTDITKASVTDLNPNTEYQFRIISFNKDGRKCRQCSNILNTRTSPCKPQRPHSSSIVLIIKNQFLATISLPKPPYDETGSEIQEMSIQRLGEHRTPEESTPNLNNPFIYKIPNKRDEMIIIDIPIGSATHYIRVKLKNSMGYSVYSQPVGVAPENFKPGAPTITNKEKINPITDSVVVEWEAPVIHKRAANKYMFVLKRDSDSDWSQPIKPDNLEQNGDSLKAILRNLSPCTRYKVCAFAANGAVHGDYSEAISILTKAGKPHAPPIPSIHVKEDPTEANVSFEHKIEHDNGASIELIRVEHHTKENGWTLIHEENVQDPTSDFFNVNIPIKSVDDVNQPEYQYRVKLKNKVGEGSPSEVVRLPYSILKPGKVQGVEYEAKAHQVMLRWKIPDFHPAIVNSYTIKEQTSEGENSWTPQQICELGTNSCTLLFLASNKTYVYRITAISKSDRKGVPFIVRARTEEIYPTMPLNLRVDKKCSNMLKVRWEEPQCDPDALYYYKLEVYEDSANMKLVYTCTLKKNCRSKIVGNLNASTTYLIRATAMNEEKHSKEQGGYNEIREKTPMSKTKRNVASTLMGIPTLGLGAAAFLYLTKPDADSTMIDSDDESSYIDEWSLQELGEQVNGDRSNDEAEMYDIVYADQLQLCATSTGGDGDATDLIEGSSSSESDKHHLLM